MGAYEGFWYSLLIGFLPYPIRASDPAPRRTDALLQGAKIVSSLSETAPSFSVHFFSIAYFRLAGTPRMARWVRRLAVEVTAVRREG